PQYLSVVLARSRVYFWTKSRELDQACTGLSRASNHIPWKAMKLSAGSRGTILLQGFACQSWRSRITQGFSSLSFPLPGGMENVMNGSKRLCHAANERWGEKGEDVMLTFSFLL